MTHEELPYIAIIKDLNKLIRKQMKAIDAVMDLHKPIPSDRYEDNGFYCGECDTYNETPDYYPCPTIEAIEKELG
jgi:hypothetical protein